MGFGWHLPLHKAFMRAIIPDKPSTADMTTLIEQFLRQVSRDVEEGASGPEAFTLLLRRLMTHFDRVDTGEGYARLHSFGVCTGTSFCDFCRKFLRAIVGSHGERAHSSSWGKRGFGGGSDGGERAFPVLDAYFVPWFDGNGPKAIRFLGRDVEGVDDLSNSKTPVINGENKK